LLQKLLNFASQNGSKFLNSPRRVVVDRTQSSILYLFYLETHRDWCSFFLIYNNNVTRITSSGKIESRYHSPGPWTTQLLMQQNNYRLYQHSECCFLLLSRKSTPTPLLKLYLTTVRPHLEYASSVWDHHLKKDTEDIEHVQTFALKFGTAVECQLSLGSRLKKDTEDIKRVQKVCALKLWYCSYYNLLNLANIPTIALRRQQLKLLLNCCSPFPDSPVARIASAHRTSIRSTNSAIHIYCHDPLPTPICFNFPL